MKKGIVIIFIIMLSPFASFANDWSKQDTYRELAFTTLITIDYLQTRTIVQNPDKYFEYNPATNRHPRQRSMDIYMTSCAVLHPIISYLLPPKSNKWKWINRENWQYITIGIEVISIGNNFRIGIVF